MEKQNIHKINGEVHASLEFKRMMDFFIHMNAIIVDFKEMLQLEDDITEIVVQRYNNEIETNTWEEKSIWN